MNKLRSGLDKVTELSSIIIFAVMVLLVAFQVFVRYVLNNPSAFSEALTRYLFVWLVLVTATYAFGKREHMCISFLKEKAPMHMQHKINMAIEALSMVFAGLVMVYGGIRIAAMQMVQLDSVLKIPTGLIYSIIPICGVGIVCYSLCNIRDEWDALCREKGGN